MADEKPKSNIKELIQKEEPYLNNILSVEDLNKFKELTEELRDTWSKKQVFRTETEMRVAVIDDGRYPTKAAKYWQAVREQGVFLENLMALSFDYRRNEVKIKRLQKKLENETDDLKKELYQISLDEKVYAKASMEQVAKDRMREIKLWSQIKSELDDGSFDNKDVNAHQKESLKQILEIRYQNITPNTPHNEKLDIISQLDTMNRVRAEGVLENKSTPTQSIGTGTNPDTK
jgi:hypothetical protein